MEWAEPCRLWEEPVHGEKKTRNQETDQTSGKEIQGCPEYFLPGQCSQSSDPSPATRMLLNFHSGFN